MSKRKSLVPLLLALAFAFACSPAAAQADLQRSFVSTFGGDRTDEFDCRQRSPCRTLARALERTAPGGVIVLLTGGGYGPATIRRAVTIVAVENHAGINADAGDAIRVEAETGDSIVLRGLELKGGTGIGSGVVVTGGHVLIDDCLITNFRGTGISQSGASDTSTVRVTRSAILYNIIGVSGAVWSFRDNRLAGNFAVNVFPAAPSDSRLQ